MRPCSVLARLAELDPCLPLRVGDCSQAPTMTEPGFFKKLSLFYNMVGYHFFTKHALEEAGELEKVCLLLACSRLGGIPACGGCLCGILFVCGLAGTYSCVLRRSHVHTVGVWLSD